jgi:hypothetical protein
MAGGRGESYHSGEDHKYGKETVQGIAPVAPSPFSPALALFTWRNRRYTTVVLSGVLFRHFLRHMLIY